MNRRHVAALVLASLLAACSGSGRLPAAVVVEPPATTTGPSTPPIECPSDQVLPDGITQASYEPDGPLPAATDLPAGSTMAAIRDSGVLRVGVSADTLLFSSLDPQDNTIKGFDMDMLLEVAKAIFGVNTEAEARSHLAITVIPYRERLPKLKADEVDIVAHTMTINCVRWQQIAFSSEYFHAGQRVLVKVGSPFESIESLDEAGASVCVPDGSTNQENLAAYTNAVPIVVKDLSDCLVLLQQGEADSITGDDTVLAGLAAQDPATKVVGPQFSNEPYGLGIRADRVDFVRFVNALIQEMRTDGRWAAIYERWLVPSLTDEVPEPPAARYGRVEG
jgi:polar amino acid transport system substrate-binding protein